METFERNIDKEVLEEYIDKEIEEIEEYAPTREIKNRLLEDHGIQSLSYNDINRMYLFPSLSPQDNYHDAMIPYLDEFSLDTPIVEIRDARIAIPEAIYSSIKYALSLDEVSVADVSQVYNQSINHLIYKEEEHIKDSIMSEANTYAAGGLSYLVKILKYMLKESENKKILNNLYFHTRAGIGCKYNVVSSIDLVTIDEKNNTTAFFILPIPGYSMRKATHRKYIMSSLRVRMGVKHVIDTFDSIPDLVVIYIPIAPESYGNIRLKTNRIHLAPEDIYRVRETNLKWVGFASNPVMNRVL